MLPLRGLGLPAASREKEWPEAKAEKPGAVRKPGEEGELVS